MFDANHDPGTVPDETKVCTGIEYAYLVSMKDTQGAEVDLYDSGATLIGHENAHARMSAFLAIISAIFYKIIAT